MTVFGFRHRAVGFPGDRSGQKALEAVPAAVLLLNLGLEKYTYVQWISLVYRYYFPEKF